MTNHHSSLSAGEEIYRILAVLARVPTDKVTVKHDHHTVAKQRLTLTNSTSLPRACSSAPSTAPITFEIERAIVNMMQRTEESISQKIFLPQRPNEPRFAPQQYYYAASKSGVMPSWAISAAAHPARYDGEAR
jgi:hypothetical protein